MVRTGLGGLASALGVSSVRTQLSAPPQQRCSVSAMLVLYGLPRLLAGSIIAHELMHAYLRMRHVTGLPLQVGWYGNQGVCADRFGVCCLGSAL